MKRTACLTLLFACASHAAAQAPVPTEHGAYLSGELGNGKIYGEGAVGERSMRWRAFEARVGRDFRLSGADPLATARTLARIDFVYDNEGHPDNNHRDGFSLQFVLAQRLGNSLTAEAGVGPYCSMNTTTIGGEELNLSRRGILYTAALRFPLPGFDPGTHVRLGFNHVSMRDAPNSNAVMIGIGRHFTDVPGSAEMPEARGRLWLGASVGRSYTSHAMTDTATSATLEAKQYGGQWAGSLKAVFEGDDGKRVDRRGIAAQLWYVQPLTERWSASAAIGPYVAVNRRDDNRVRVLGIYTLQFERNLGERTKAFLAFHRVKSFQERNDRDLFQLGLQHVFGHG